MALKRRKGPDGRLVVVEHTSKILDGNALGDPHVRKLAVWLPPQYDDGAGNASRPAFPGALRPGRLHRLGPRARQLEALRRQRARARGAAHPREEDGAGDHRLPRLLHRARRQPVRQLVGDRQLRRLPHARDHPVRRPRVPHARLARAPRLLRQVVRRLRRDHPRHEVRAVLGRDRRSFGRCVLRLRLLARLAEHAERAGEVSGRSSARPAATTRCAKDGVGASPTAATTGAIKRFLEHVWEAEKLTVAEGHTIMNLCMAATYDPDPQGAARLPPAVQPGDRRADRRRAGRSGLRTTRSTWSRSTGPTSNRCAASTSIAAGATSTTSTTARASCRSASPQAGIAHTYEEFDDNHSDVDYRMDVSLPFLYRALKP